MTLHDLQLSRLCVRVAVAGQGYPVVLLHGWPQTHYAWRHLVPLLAPHYRLVMPDLPGLGDSTQPLEGGFDTRSVGQDLAELCDALALADFHLVGHDWGGPSAFGLVAARPHQVRSFTLIDVTLPGLGPDFSQGGRRWHHAFHATPELPESLVTGRERAYLGWFYTHFAWQRAAISTEDREEYLRCYTRPEVLAAGFAYYRALDQDVAYHRALVEAGFRLQMPVLALGGDRAQARGRGMEPLESLRSIAPHVQGGVVPDSGHFVPEEQPAWLADRLLRFLAAAGDPPDLQASASRG